MHQRLCLRPSLLLNTVTTLKKLVEVNAQGTGKNVLPLIFCSAGSYNVQQQGTKRSSYITRTWSRVVMTQAATIGSYSRHQREYENINQTVIPRRQKLDFTGSSPLGLEFNANRYTVSAGSRHYQWWISGVCQYHTIMEAENQQQDSSSNPENATFTSSDNESRNDNQTGDKREESSTSGIDTDRDNKNDDGTTGNSENVISDGDANAVDADVTKTTQIDVTEVLSDTKSDDLKHTNKSDDDILSTNTSSQPPTANNLTASATGKEDQDAQTKIPPSVQTNAQSGSSPQTTSSPEHSLDDSKITEETIETILTDDRSPIVTTSTASDSAATIPLSPGIPTREDDAKSPTLDTTESWKTDGSSSSVDGVARLQVNEDGVDVGGDAGNGEIVVVTGGCGFLGQHVVKMLQMRAPHVSEIRVLDVKEFEQKLEYTAKKPVRSIVGSVADSKVVRQVVRGAHSVIHVAGLISWGTFPDLAGMEETNVIGTVNIFNACLKNNVQRLLYCSTVDVAVGFQPIQGGDEANTPVPPPDGFMFPGYPETKYQGERVVLNSARVLRQDGENLQTVILRANVLYGELDTSYVINGLRGANQSKGVLRQIGDGMAMFQQSYAGNTAWAFVCADQAMRENPELTTEVFYVPDNTPVQNSFNFMRPYLEARGFRLSESRLSYALVHSAVRVAEVLAKGLSPIYRFNLPVQSYSVQYINTSIYFSGEKARKVLGYEPIFTPNEARQACLNYYKTVDLS